MTTTAPTTPTTPTTPATTATTATTASINNILIDLSNLHTAFTAVLEQAQQQLEAYELTDHDIQRISNLIASNYMLRDRMADGIIRSISDQVETALSDPHGTYTTRTLIERLTEAIEQKFTNRIVDLASDYLRSDHFERAVHAAINRQMANNPDGPIARLGRQRLIDALAVIYRGCPVDVVSAVNDAHQDITSQAANT